MYLQFFGLSEPPFSITPDPAFVYLSAAHRDALAHLLYGVGKGGAGGFVQLTGEVGTGKTTICRCLLEQVPEDTIIALILNPMVTPKELLASICEELGIDIEGIKESSKALVDALSIYLLQQHAQDRRVVVVIDEAQNLSPDALEQVRLLTNLETAKHKLLQMVLLGQPELRQLLQRQNLRQLAQRITARYHLAPLGEQETAAYVVHRMKVAGARQSPFKASAMRAIYRRSGGVPRLINIIADRALAGAYAKELANINAKLVNAAADEVQPSETQVRKNHWPVMAATMAALVLATVSILMWGLPGQTPNSQSKMDQASSESAAQPATSSPPPSQASMAIEGQTESLAKAETTVSAENADPGDSAQAAVGLTDGVESLIVDTVSPFVSEVVPLDSKWLNEQHASSWSGLAELWQDKGNENAIQAACDGQGKTGYACLFDQGSWARVERLGLPVILILRDEGDRQVLFRGFEGNRLLLGSGDNPDSFQREIVESKWLGEYLVAWPQAPDWPEEIKRGESGTAVDIVMQMASKVEPAWTGTGVFDAGFESWLMGFQRQNALTADGIIGPKTLLYLMAPTITKPRLSKTGDKRS